MKLLNQSVKHLSISLLLIIGVWGTVLFFNIVDEVKENVDEGLENYKRQIVFRAHQDTAVLKQMNLNENFYSIQEIGKGEYFDTVNIFTDTMIRVQDADDVAPRLAPVRMLKTAFEDGGKKYRLKIINPMIENEDLIERLFENMIWLYISLIFAIVLINNIVLRRVWRPFYNLLAQMKAYRLGKGESLPEVKTKTKEFIDLQKAIDTLLRHNIRIYEQQKSFIGNAAHELQTPLAIVINKLELLIEKGELSEDQAHSIVKTMQIIERLTRLNKSLLLLSKIENRQFIQEQEVDFNTLIAEEIESLQDVADFKKIKISVVENKRFTKTINFSLAHILVSNLLRNALFHNIEKGNVYISIQKNKLTISNTGIKKPLDRDHIFKSFYKSSSKSENTGLGLAIAKAIADIYGISINYYFRNEHHHFEMKI